MFSHSVLREAFTNQTPPPHHQNYLGEGGLDPLNHNFHQKGTEFLLQFILQGQFWYMWAESSTLGLHKLGIGGQTDPLIPERGGGLTCVCSSLGAIAVTEGLPPPSGAYILALGVQESSKTENFLNPPLTFYEIGGRGVNFVFDGFPISRTSGREGVRLTRLSI